MLGRVEVNGTGNCFITFKDRKTNFFNDSITRLVNPARNKIKRTSKEILDRIISLCYSVTYKLTKGKVQVVQWHGEETFEDRNLL